MTVGRQFLNGQKSRGMWWQKLAEEYKICTLHVTCHSQVKHMRIPMASALSRFPLCQDGQDFLVDGDFPNPRQRLALLDVDVLLAQIHIACR